MENFIDEKNFDYDENILNQDINPKIEPILFGSEVSLNIADKPELFLYSDGFIDTKICCVNIMNANKNIISFGTNVYNDQTMKE